MASKKTAKKSVKSNPAMSKSDFIRSMPPDMPAKEVVSKGADQGLSLSEKYVYNIRSAQRPVTARRAGGALGRRTGRDMEAQLRHAIAELGLARAREVFDDVANVFAGSR